MKTLVSLLLLLLLAGVGGAAYFYIYLYEPMAVDYARMKTGMPGLDKAKAELAKYKEKEKKEAAWVNPMIDTLSAVLSDEIQAGKAEVLSTDGKVVVNISEQALYTPGSKTFAKDSPKLLAKIDSLLRNDAIKGKDIHIGNTTQAAQAQGKGRKRIPAKDARTLAAERSMELLKYLEKKGVNPDALIAAAYSSKQPEIGFKIKSNKTVIIIGTPPVVPMVATKPVVPEAQTKPAPQAQPKPIPIRPAQPKSN